MARKPKKETPAPEPASRVVLSLTDAELASVGVDLGSARGSIAGLLVTFGGSVPEATLLRELLPKILPADVLQRLGVLIIRKWEAADAGENSQTQ